MVRWPESISSAKPFSCPSEAARALNSGCSSFARRRLNSTFSGTVTANTSTSGGEMVNIITSEPATVAALTATCNASCESDSPTASMS